MPRKLILIKSRLSQIGGLEKYTWKIAEHFCKLGIDVTLLTSENPTPPFQHPQLSLISFPIHKALSVQKVTAFDQACSAYIRSHPADCVFSLDRNRHQTHLRAGNGVHAAYLQQRAKEEGWWKGMGFRINPLHRTLLRLEKLAFENPQLKALFVNSHMVKEEVLCHYRVDPETIQVVHNGVEWHALQEPFDKWESEKQKLCAQLHLNPSSHQLLFLGNNYKRKGLEKLLNALNSIPDEKFQLHVIGKDKTADSFKSLTKSYRDKVFFWGPRTDSFSFYQLADTVLIPSLYDPFANVTVEALAMGVSVMTSAFNGGKEILTKINGQIIPDLNAFSHLLKNRMHERKTAHSARAIRASVEHLDFSHQLEKISRLTLGN